MPTRLIAPNVLCGPKVAVTVRETYKQEAIAPQKTMKMLKGRTVVPDMFKNIKQQHLIEGLILLIEIFQLPQANIDLEAKVLKELICLSELVR